MSAFRQLYYELKPYIPDGVRLRFRQHLARMALSKSRKSWPILEQAGREPAFWPGWPRRKKCAIVLTHDVEGPRGLERCRALMNLERQFGLVSSFNFIPEGPYQASKELRDELFANGFEVGVHDWRHDGKLYRSKDSFSEGAARINQYLRDWNCVGFRSGFMHHNLDWLHELNIAYDMSTFDTDPFEPQPDGVETIFPFWVQNSHGKGYMELPYTLPQDSTLFLLLRERTIEVWKQKLEWIARKGGMALLNVHPDYINFEDRWSFGEYPVSLYREFLTHIKENYSDCAWFALPSEVSAYLHDQSSYKDSRMSLSAVARPSTPLNRPSPLKPTEKKATVEISSLTGKRTAVVVFSYYPSDPRVRREAEALQAAGCAIDVFCLKGEGERKFETLDGINIYRLPLERQRGGKLRYFYQYGLFLLLAFFRLSARTMSRSLRYDIVHVHNMPDILVFSAVLPKLAGAKVLLDLHDPTPEVFSTLYGLGAKSMPIRILCWLEQAALAFANLGITPNISFKKLFVARGCSPNKLLITMNSPQTEVFEKAKLRSAPSVKRSGYHLMFHGSLLERHGLDDLLNAVAALREKIPGLQLDIYGGRTPYVDTIEEQIQALQLEDCVIYHGGRSLEEIATLIPKCDLGVIPNKRTPFTELNMPTRIFEYLEMDRPVIAPRTEGIRDYFKEDQIVFFEPGSAADLEQKIYWAYRHPKELQEITHRGRLVYLDYRWPTQRQTFVETVASLFGSVKKT